MGKTSDGRFISLTLSLEVAPKKELPVIFKDSPSETSDGEGASRA
jgi:hypothetical protein